MSTSFIGNFGYGDGFGAPGSWASGGNLSLGRTFPGGCGTQTAGLCFGGTNIGGGNLSTSEEYDGTSWTSGGTMASTRTAPSGAGTQTAGLAIAGVSSSYVASCEEYNGTSWSSGGALPVTRAYGTACGTQTAALSIGGLSDTGISPYYYYYYYGSAAYTYDGTTWTGTGSLSTGRQLMTSVGSTSDALCFGGYYQDGSGTTCVNLTERFNGSTWSTVNPLPVLAYGQGAFGNSASAVIASVGTNLVSWLSYTYQWNGTSWSSILGLPNYVLSPGSGGNFSSGVIFGGKVYSGGSYIPTAATYEYNK